MEPMMVSTTALEMSPHSVRQARNFFRSGADRFGVSAEVRDAGSLAVSEIVTNAIRHGAGPIELRTTFDRSSILVEVSDRGSSMPVATTDEPDMTGGRGLRIIDAVAQAWGCDRHGNDDGKTVWFTLPRSAPN